MIFNIEFTFLVPHTTRISFKGKDLTSIEEVQRCVSAVANSYCFEANSVLSEEFKNFINSVVRTSSKKYIILVGLDPEGQPFVYWE